VKRIGAVSGGRILAAHLVLNWERYLSGDSANGFDAAAQELIMFVRSDIRGRVIRRWILAWLTLAPRLLQRRRWTFTVLLKQLYDPIFQHATLGALRGEREDELPEVFFYCTSLSTGRICSFDRSGFTWDEEDEEGRIDAPETDIAFAVAASSAFPPLFPPIAVSHATLSCDVKEFPIAQYLTDGGVYDNLGIDRMLWYHERVRDLDLFLVSDAEGNFEWDLGNAYRFITSRNIRASNLLMKRVSTLATQAARQQPMVRLKIDSPVQDPDDPAPLSPEVQRTLRNMRTDLDAFSETEVDCLIRHGYAVARARLAERNLLPDPPPVFSWTPISRPKANHRHVLAEIKRSRYRKWRLWSPSDWASWATICVVGLLVSVILLPTYRNQRKLVERANRAEEASRKVRDLKLVAAPLNAFATDYLRGRRRPLEVGTSVGTSQLLGGTICCFVKPREGGSQRFLLGGRVLAAAIGEEIVQPAKEDGGKFPDDIIAKVSDVLPEGVPTIGQESLRIFAVLAELSVPTSSRIGSLGELRQTSETYTQNQEVLIVGKSTGVTKGVINSVASSLPDRGLEGLIQIGIQTADNPLMHAGDNGAPVLTPDGRLLGMIVDWSSSGVFAMPIRTIFDALGVELDVTSEQEEISAAQDWHT